MPDTLGQFRCLFLVREKGTSWCHPTALLRTPSSLARQTAPALRPRSPLALARHQPDGGASHVLRFRCQQLVPAFFAALPAALKPARALAEDRKSTRLNSSHANIS